MSWWIKKAAQSHTNSWLQKSLIHRDYIHYGASDTFSDAHSHSVTQNPIKLRKTNMQMSCMFNWKQHVMLNVTLFGFVPSYDQKKSMVVCCCFFFFYLGLITCVSLGQLKRAIFHLPYLHMYNQYINHFFPLEPVFTGCRPMSVRIRNEKEMLHAFDLQVDWWCSALKFLLVLLKCEVSGHCAPSKKS